MSLDQFAGIDRSYPCCKCGEPVRVKQISKEEPDVSMIVFWCHSCAVIAEAESITADGDTEAGR